ncbi:CRISPR-associated protein Cas4 [Moraxella caviae]|nr:CRISPR-associated protein Cas4 [Moraxella caviae]
MDNVLYLSQLQHYIYCPRQFALIELEQVWQDNQFTAEGQILHEKANSGTDEKRGDVKIVRTLPLAQPELNIFGVADVVEYHTNNGETIPYPIEYKRGRPKAHRADEVQLCGQALCLEYMHACHVPEGAIFYGEKKRRHSVVFDETLRELTLNTIRACQDIIVQKITPKAHYSTNKCRNCSLKDICHPKVFSKGAKKWLLARLQDG